MGGTAGGFEGGIEGEKGMTAEMIGGLFFIAALIVPFILAWIFRHKNQVLLIASLASVFLMWIPGAYLTITAPENPDYPGLMWLVFDLGRNLLGSMLAQIMIVPLLMLFLWIINKIAGPKTEKDSDIEDVFS